MSSLNPHSAAEDLGAAAATGQGNLVVGFGDDGPLEGAPEDTPGDTPDGDAGDEPDFDPADHNVEDVKAYLDANPDDKDRVLEAERAGKNRSTLVGD